MSGQNFLKKYKKHNFSVLKIETTVFNRAQLCNLQFTIGDAL